MMRWDNITIAVISLLVAFYCLGFVFLAYTLKAL